MSSKSAVIKPVDPTEWANKRKAAVERARLKREELKSGISPEEHTFAPQINKRPAYLDSNKNKDSLDALALVYSNPTNDVFEKPLPGNKSYSDGRAPLPDADTLVKEVNKYPKPKQNVLENHSYDQPNNQSNNVNYSQNNVTNKNDDSDLFMNILRSDNRKSVGPGWNDDFSSNGSFDNIKKPPIGRRNKGLLQNKLSELNENSKPRIIEKSDSLIDYDIPIKTTKISPTISPRLNPDQQVINQARSKLHVLKSRIRRSESGGSARPSNFLSDQTNISSKSDSLVNVIPKSAPYSINDGYNRPVEHTQPAYQPSFNKPPVRKPLANNRYDVENIDNNNANQYAQYNQSIQRKSIIESNGYNNSNQYNQYDQTPQRGQSTADNYESNEDIDNNEENNNILYDENGVELELFECPDCSRKFNEKALQKHTKICAKVFLQKRKVFDSTKMRVQDNPELVNILLKKKKGSRRQPQTVMDSPASAILKNREDAPLRTNEKQSKWKEQSKQFRENMKQARLVSQAIKAGDPLPPVVISSTPDPSLIQCPHCERRFNEKAAERHIPLCTNIRAKPNTLKKGQGGGGGVNGGPSGNNTTNSTMKKSLRR